MGRAVRQVEVARDHRMGDGAALGERDDKGQRRVVQREGRGAGDAARPTRFTIDFDFLRNTDGMVSPPRDWLSSVSICGEG